MKFCFLNAKLVEIFYICKYFVKKTLLSDINIRKKGYLLISPNKKTKKMEYRRTPTLLTLNLIL